VNFYPNWPKYQLFGSQSSNACKAPRAHTAEASGQAITAKTPRSDSYPAHCYFLQSLLPAILFFLGWDWGLNSGLCTYKAGAHTSLFFSGYFGDGLSRTICPVWPPALILPNSTSQVVRITGLSHWHQISWQLSHCESSGFHKSLVRARELLT
jgi:hypothetical protein